MNRESLDLTWSGIIQLALILGVAGLACAWMYVWFWVKSGELDDD